ncbi:hypothetical protein ACFSZS_12455 [Seohaeicola zhoushanensis]
MTGGNELHIQGLPFTVDNLNSNGGPGTAWMSNVIFTELPVLVPKGGTSALRLRESVSGGASTTVAVSQLTSGTASIWGRGSYRTA